MTQSERTKIAASKTGGQTFETELVKRSEFSEAKMWQQRGINTEGVNLVDTNLFSAGNLISLAGF